MLWHLKSENKQYDCLLWKIGVEHIWQKEIFWQPNSSKSQTFKETLDLFWYITPKLRNIEYKLPLVFKFLLLITLLFSLFSFSMHQFLHVSWCYLQRQSPYSRLCLGEHLLMIYASMLTAGPMENDLCPLSKFKLLFIFWGSFLVVALIVVLGVLNRLFNTTVNITEITSGL